MDALDGVTHEFKKGVFTAIMGPSGSGKSTLMHCLAGLDRPTGGSVTIDGVELAELDDGDLTQLRRDKLGFIFQFFNLLPVLSAEENVILPLSIAGRKPDKAWLDQLLHTVGLDDRRTHRPSELSGGQQQRVAVARALVSQAGGGVRRRAHGQPGLATRAPRCLSCCGVPSSDLGQSVVMVTHDSNAASYADRLLVLVDGKIVHDGRSASADEILDLMKTVG